MDLKAIQELMESDGVGVSELGMRNIDQFLKQGGKRLQKDKLEPGTSGKRIYALAIRFPFDPTNPTDKSKGFNKDNKWESPISPESTVIWLKGLMRDNEELHAFYAKRGGMTVDEYDVSKDEITDQDWAVFGSDRNLLHYALRVVKSTLTGHGKMGRKFLSKCKYDSDGTIIEKDTAQDIHELEVAIAKQRIAEIQNEYKNGSKVGKLEKDMKEEIKVVWKGVKMSAPYYAGSIRTLVIPLNDDLEMEKPEEVLKDGIQSLEYYAGGSKQAIEKLMGYIGRKADKNFNYLEVDIQYPKCDNVEQDQRALESYQKRTENAVNPVSKIREVLPEFDKLYREFRDNTDIFCEQVMLDSVFEYHAIDTATLLELYKTDLADRKDYIDSATAKTYGNLIKQVDEALSDEIIDKMLEDELPEPVGSLEQLAGITEDTVDDSMEGYGIDNFVVESTDGDVVLE